MQTEQGKRKKQQNALFAWPADSEAEFMSQTSMDVRYARYYLEKAKGDLEEAVKLYNEDPNDPFESEQKEKEISALQRFLQLFQIQNKARTKGKYRTFDDVVSLLKERNKIVIVAGAGISVSCGIPDFRSKDGFYSKLKKKGLGRPEDIFTLSTFLQDPSIYYSNSADLCPTNYIPSPTHFFFAKLEAEGKLLRVFTQNIDDLEAKAGVSRLVQCHGSMGSAACMQCHHEVPIETIEEELRAGEIAYCRVCDKNKREKRGVYKPDVVFFGENLPKRFFDLSSLEMPLADMVIVVGTALAVHPVADLPSMVSNVDETPQVLINREVVGTAGWFDAHLLGNSDDAIIELVKAMGWEGEVPISLEDRRWATEEIGKLRNEERNRLSGGDKEEQKVKEGESEGENKKEEDAKRNLDLMRKEKKIERDTDGLKKVKDILIASCHRKEEGKEEKEDDKKEKKDIIRMFLEPNYTTFKTQV